MGRFSIGAKDLGKDQAEKWVLSFRPSHAPLRSLNLILDRTRLGTRQPLVSVLLHLIENRSITNHETQFQFDCLQAFTTLHMMYHEATACHVTGDLTEVLMILNNLLVCCRPHSNKPGTVRRSAYGLTID